MSLEEAVYRLTGKTALMHDLPDRGFIAPGKAADITIFDPDTIASKPRELAHDLPARERRHCLGFNHPETTPPSIPTTPRTAPTSGVTSLDDANGPT